jgi:hypothetical protein
MSTELTNIKECTKCRLTHAVGMFYKKGTDSTRTDSQCKFCRATAVRQYRLDNPERVKAIQKRTNAKHREKHRERAAKWYKENHEYALTQQAVRRKENPDPIRSAKLQAAFGIGLDEYNRLLVNQDYKCAICGRHESNITRRLAVDHCHTTGKVRGLLCGPCNTGLGLFKDSPSFLTNAINYLKTK